MLKNSTRSRERVAGLLAKTEFSREFQIGRVLKSLPELFAAGIIARELENIFVACINHPRREHQEIGAEGFQSGGAPVLGKAQSPEPVNEVAGKQDGLKVRDIGNPIAGWNFGQGVVVNQFADVFFDVGSKRVKQVDPPGAGFQVGDKNMIDVFFVLDQFELFGFHQNSPASQPLLSLVNLQA